jgi:hypothetical protein
MHYSTLEQHMVKDLSIKASVACLNKIYFISNLLCTSLNWFKLEYSAGDEIYTQVHSYHIHVAYQKSHEIKLACKRYIKDSLLLNFKITLKALSFKLNFSNKSCRTGFWSITELV